LIVGELGRFMFVLPPHLTKTFLFTLEHSSDMEPQTDIFACVIDHFVSEQEETRAAAAFAAGE
jgi:hypothetical protein